jgi:OFA family oxalate/formate antiporter-like MFS transporter
MDSEDRSVIKSEARTRLRGGLRGIFFGWWTVLACNLMTVWGHSLYVYGYGVFLKPLAEEFGWTRAMTAGAGSLGRIEGGVEGPFGGMATDRYGPRIVCFTGSFLAGLGLVLMSLVNSVFSFYAVWLLTSTGFNLGLGGPLYTAVSQWFVKKRGLAQSLTAAGFSVGGSIMPMIMTYLLFRYGWRGMFIRAGLISWAILLPLSWFFIKPHRPEYYGFLPDGAKVEEGMDTDSMLKAGEAYAHEVGEVEFTARQAY